MATEKNKRALSESEAAERDRRIAEILARVKRRLGKK
jgi:hypothetical protein